MYRKNRTGFISVKCILGKYIYIFSLNNLTDLKVLKGCVLLQLLGNKMFNTKHITLVIIRIIQVKVSCTKNRLNLLLHDHFPPALTFKRALLIYL